jgi:hypothetical protein
MPKLAIEDLKAYAVGGYRSWETDWEGWTVSVERVHEDIDATEQFSALPGGGCQCPHWGYVISGVSHYKFTDRTETYRAGDFFFLQPGHSPRHEAGTEWVCFSPTAEHGETQRQTRTDAP